MLGGVSADVVMLVDGRVWRARLAVQAAADRAPGAEIVRTSETVVWVPDAAAAPLWRDAPQVTGPPFVRFFAGAPVVLSSGARIGSVQAHGLAPRALDAA